MAQKDLIFKYVARNCLVAQSVCVRQRSPATNADFSLRNEKESFQIGRKIRIKVNKVLILGLLDIIIYIIDINIFTLIMFQF